MWLSIASGGTSVAKFLVPIHLPHHDVVGMGAQGTTVHVQQHDFTRIYSTNLPPIPERGTLVAGLQIGGRKWEIWGHYNLVEHKEGAFLARTYQRARHGAGRLARLGQGAVIRIKGQDEHGTQVAVTFRRMSTGREGGDIYQVQSMTIHVPQTGAQRSVERDFLNAEDINPYGDVIDPNVALSPYGGGGDDDDMAPPPPPPPDDDEPIVPGMGILTGAAKATRDALEGAADVLTGMESRIATPVTLTRTNPENRVHVAALINAVAAQQAELKELFQDMELTGDPVEVKQIQRELTEVARLRSVLETHLAILAAEAAGEKELENISSNVHAAISQSHSLIGISPGNRFSRWSETRRLRRRARTMSRDDATAAFLQAVADAEAAQANSQVGTQFIERANIYYERLLQVSGHGQASVKDAAAKLQYLKATEHRRYKGKEQRKKQQRGKVDAEEEERLASGQ